jgi:hypothetical protein
MKFYDRLLFFHCGPHELDFFCGMMLSFGGTVSLACGVAVYSRQ